MYTTTPSTPIPTSLASTPLGTPCASSWDATWRDTVVAAEEELGRRICGAKTPTGRPCSFESCGKNGRCRFHGGADLAGGQPGNRNGTTHGLYARGLRPCSTGCPHWATCPMAGDDVKEIAAVNRPVCPYESKDFEDALEGFMEVLNTATVKPCHPQDHAMPIHLVDLAHRVAMLHVMVNRTSAALRETDMVDTPGGADGTKRAVAKPHAYLQAYLRLSNEYRRYLALLQQQAREKRGSNPRLPARAAVTVGGPIAVESRWHDAPARSDVLPTPTGTGPESHMDAAFENSGDGDEMGNGSGVVEGAEWTNGQVLRFPDRHRRNGNLAPPVTKKFKDSRRDLDEAFDHRAHQRYREAILAFNRALVTCRELALVHYREFQALELKLPPCAPEKRIIVTPR